MFKTDGTNTCDKCGKEIGVGDSFSAIDPATRQWVDYCADTCIPEGMTNCGYCSALRREDELDKDYKCINGCVTV